MDNLSDEKPRKIIHLDLDSFFCAVEELLDPSLKGKPFAVGGSPSGRGVISSCSYPSRRYGVRSAMPTARALRLCPELHVLHPRHKIYSQKSSEVFSIVRTYSSLVEQISIDEAFLDVTELHESAEHTAERLQASIHNTIKLPCSLGVASNKLIAKIANNVGKLSASGDSPPKAITIVEPGEEASFLAPLPVEALWGVGPRTAERLAEIGILTIGDLANYSTSDLLRLLGNMGPVLSMRSRGIDNSPVVTYHEPKSFSREVTFTRDVRDIETLQHTLKKLSLSVGKRLKAKHRYGSVVKIKLRWPDFNTITRQVSLPSPTNQDELIYEMANGLFENVWKEGVAVRLIGVGVSGLSPVIKQLSLWEHIPQPESVKELRLQNALKLLRERYGEKIVQRASDLKSTPKIIINSNGD